jgi:hypothetical protein
MEEDSMDRLEETIALLKRTEDKGRDVIVGAILAGETKEAESWRQLVYEIQDFLRVIENEGPQE